MAGYYDFMLVVRVSVRSSVCLSYIRPSVISFLDGNLSERQWVFTKFGICIDIVEIWFGIANGQISSILTELSARDTSFFSFPDDDLSKYQWSFTKHGMWIVVEIWFRILFVCVEGLLPSQPNGVMSSAVSYISSIFDRVICTRHIHFHFRTINWINHNSFSPNLVCALILRSGLGLLLGTFHQFLTVISPSHDNGGVFSFPVFIYKYLGRG